MRFDWVSCTTDYGLTDGFVAACHGVIAQIAPGLRLIDVTHAVPPQDVRRGAELLAQTVEYLPPAVHLAVVDPGVGTARRPIALRTGNGLLVGPDNGLLLPAADALGGAREAVQLTEPAYRLPRTSATFHGRDIFAPAAAHLALGVALDALGPAVPIEALVRLDPPRVDSGDGVLRAELLGSDHFGNLQLAATGEQLARFRSTGPVTVTLAGRTHHALLGRTFTDVAHGELVLYPDSTGRAALAVNGGSARTRCGDPRPGELVTIAFS